MPDDLHLPVLRRNPEDIDLAAIKTDLECIMERAVQALDASGVGPTTTPRYRWERRTRHRLDRAFLAALPVSALATLGTHFAAIEDELDFVESQLVRVPRQKQLARYSLLVMLGEQGYASAVKV